MRKRFNLTWRVVTALLMVLALVPALAVHVAVAETTPPTLLSIGWVDDGDGIIDFGDSLMFYFSESMDVSALNDVPLVNARLDSTAAGTNDYGSTLANVIWGLANTRLQVVLGIDCSDTLAGKWVNPTADVKDASGNGDVTTGDGRQIPVAPDKTDTSRPYLISITWVDGGAIPANANSVIDAGDILSFQFSESMDSTIIGAGTIDGQLQITGDNPTEGLNAGLIAWPAAAGNTVMQVTLGAAETISGGELMCATGFRDWHLNYCTVPSTCPSVPLQPNEAAPVLVDMVWTDQGGVGMGQGDILTFRFSESIENINTVSAPDGYPINVGNLINFLVPSSGHNFGVPTAASVAMDATNSMIYVTLGPDNANMINTADTVTPGTGPTQIRDKGCSPAIVPATARACPANPIAVPDTSATVPTTNIRETAAPTLRSITWNDRNGNGIYDGVAGTEDLLNFYWSESLDAGTLGGKSVCGAFAQSADRIFVNTRLDSTATGSEDYGTLGTTCQPWIGISDQNLQVILTIDEMLEGGEYVNPANQITDLSGHADATAGTGPRIPLPADQIRPQLLSIVWDDLNNNGRHDAGDHLVFNFDEAMSIASFAANFDAALRITGTGTESYGPGAVFAWNFGDGANWASQLVLTLGGGETIGGGETVNPADFVTDARGNQDSTSAGIPIPLAPDTTAPTLLNNIVWIDTDGDSMVDALDVFVLSWSESMNPLTITAANINAQLESTAFGVGADYGAAGLDVQWNSPYNTETRIRLGTGETFTGSGETVNPNSVMPGGVTDAFGNADGTAGAGATFPSTSGTPPTIVATPSLNFTAEINGSNPANQNFTITNSGQQTLNWTASKGQAWLTIDPTSGTQGQAITCSVNITGLAIGTYNDSISITGTGATNTPQTVAVTLTITAPATPTPTATTNATPTATVVPTATPTATPAPTAAPTATPGSGTSTGSASIGASGGSVATSDGKVEADFPAGSFSTATTVTITSGSGYCHSNTDSFIVGSTCFSITPSQEFDEPVTICVELSTYDKSLENLTLAYWSDGDWHEADNVTISSDGNTICGETTHLSDWAVVSKTGEGWQWWYWALIGGGALIIILAIILLIVLPKKGKGEEVPAEELYGEEEEEF